MKHLSIDSGLFESARNMFRYPDAEEMQSFLHGIKKLLLWAKQRDVAGAASLIKKIEHGGLDLEELLIDYTALFVNSFPHARAHPFAGWYLGDEVLFGEQDEKMRAFNAKHGVWMDEEMAWPADHIMVELEFAAIMMESFENSGDSRFIFALQELISHMNSWVPQFTEAMALYAESQFYKTAAGILSLLLSVMQNEMKGVA